MQADRIEMYNAKRQGSRWLHLNTNEPTRAERRKKTRAKPTDCESAKVIRAECKHQYRMEHKLASMFN